MSFRLRLLHPAPDLAPYVRRYVEWKEDCSGVVERPEVPYLGSPVIVVFDGDLDVGGHRGSFVAGLTDEPVFTVQSGRQHGLQIDFTPVGLSRVLGPDLADLANDVGSIDPRIDPHPTSEAVDALVRSLLVHPDPAPEEVRAIELIRGGAASVGAVADDTGWSREHLTRRLRRRFGFGAADMIRLERFDRAAGHISDGVTLARAAAMAGYADQPHMTREFGRLAGTTPRSWQRRRVPITSVQDHAAH